MSSRPTEPERYHSNQTLKYALRTTVAENGETKLNLVKVIGLNFLRLHKPGEYSWLVPDKVDRAFVTVIGGGGAGSAGGYVYRKKISLTPRSVIPVVVGYGAWDFSYPIVPDSPDYGVGGASRFGDITAHGGGKTAGDTDNRIPLMFFSQSENFLELSPRRDNKEDMTHELKGDVGLNGLVFVEF